MLKIIKRFILPIAALLICFYFEVFGSRLFPGNTQTLLYIAESGIWIFSAFILIIILDILLWGKFFENTLGRRVPGLLKHATIFIVLLLTLIGIIGEVFKKPLTGIWATSGVLGLILGFALRSLILDAFVGLAINFDRPYKIGDFVYLHRENIDGQVVDISWRTTRIETSTNNTIIIPNSMMGLMVITNFSRPSPEVRLNEILSFSDSIPVKQVKRVLLAGVKAAQSRNGFLDNHEPRVLINGSNAVGIEYKIRYWIDASKIAPSKARDAVLENILTGLQKAGISLANPTQDIYYEKMQPRTLDYKSIKDRVSLLKRIDLFEELENDELETLAANINMKTFKQDEIIFKKGQTGDSMLVLTEGLLNVYKGTSNDKEAKISQVSPGEFIGEMSFLTGEPRSATIAAGTDAIAYEITKSNLQELLNKRPEIAEIISNIAAKRSLYNIKAMENATLEEKEEQSKSLAKQILNKMISIFK